MRTLALLGAFLLAACSSVTPTPSPTATLAASPSATPAATATVSPSSTPGVSASPRPLVEGPLPAEVTAALQDALDGYVVEHDLVPSMSVAVIVPGVGAWYGASGMADLDSETAATPETVYALGSITKTYVAALTLRLAEEGYLDLDDPASDHVGPVAGSKTNGATVLQLLGMRSGIDNYTDHGQIFDDRPWTPVEILEVVGKPHFAPGQQFDYSNTNYLLLGLIAEVVTGGPLAELLHEYLLAPHGLYRTYYGASEEAPEPVAHGYQSVGQDSRDVYDGSGRLPNANTVSAAVSAGAMAGTAADVARWLYLLYGGEVLEPETQVAVLDFTASADYGLGAMRLVIPGTGQIVGHSGDIPGFQSAAYQARDSGIVVVILTNGDTLDFDGALKRLFEAAAAAL